MSNSSVSIEVSASNNYVFTNTSYADIVMYPTNESQRILIGAKSNANAGLVIGSSNISMTLQPSTSNNSISFYSGNSNLLATILASGNVGIGKQYPAYPLDVNGNINFTGTLMQNGSAYIGSQWSNNGSNLFISGSNIGIGTSVPAQLLHVAGNLQIDSNLYLTNTKFTFQGLNIKKNTSSGVTNVSTSITSIPGYTWNSNVVLNASNSNYSVSTQIGGTEYMRVNGNGNVGIGTNNPAYPLDVNGSVRMTGFINQSYTVSFDTSSNAVRDVLSYTGTVASVAFDITTVSSGSFMTATKTYSFACPYNLTANAWKRCIPLTSGTNDVDDYELQVKVYNNIGYLRVVHSVPNTASSVTLDINMKYSPGDVPTITNNTANAQYTDASWASYGFASTMQITTKSGNVGIGTLAPAYNLDVNGSMRSTGNYLNTGGYVGIGNNITTTLSNIVPYGINLSGTNSSISGPHIQAYISSDQYPCFQQLNWGHDNISLNFDCFYNGTWFVSGSNVNQYQIYKQNGKLLFTYTAACAAGSNWGNGTTSLSIAGSNVGVGTTSPAYPLDVAGNINCTGNISAGNLGMFRNRVINGDMRIAQRGTSLITGTGTSANYIVDRIMCTTSITTGGITQSNVVLTSTDTPYTYGFRNSWRTTASTACTAYSYIQCQQNIEAYNMSDFNWGTTAGVPVTLSFWMRTNMASGSGIPVAVRNGNANSTYWVYTQNITATGGGSWQYVSTTIPAPPSSSIWNSNNNSIGMEVVLAGFNGNYVSANTWTNNGYLYTSSSTNVWMTLNNYVEFTGLQLEKGTIATPFEFRPYAIELQLCQRYFSIYASYTNAYDPIGIGYTETNQGVLVLKYPVEMRANPSIALGNATATQFLISTPTNYTPTSAPTLGTPNTRVTYVIFPYTGLTGGAPANIRFASTTGPAGCYVGFSAEL